MQRQKDNLALPSAEHQAIESSQAGVETWKYKAKNSLMYYPEGEQAAWAGLGVWLWPSRRVSLFPPRGPGLFGAGGSVWDVSEGVRVSPALFGFCDVKTEVSSMCLFSGERCGLSRALSTPLTPAAISPRSARRPR